MSEEATHQRPDSDQTHRERITRLAVLLENLTAQLIETRQEMRSLVEKMNALENTRLLHLDTRVTGAERDIKTLTAGLTKIEDASTALWRAVIAQILALIGALAFAGIMYVMGKP